MKSSKEENVIEGHVVEAARRLLRSKQADDVKQWHIPGEGRYMRVLLIGNARSIHIQRWANALAERGHSVILVATERMGSDVHVPLFSQVSLLSCPLYDPGLPPTKRWFSTLRAWYAFRNIVRQQAPDIVHLHWLLNSSAILAFTGLRNLVITVWGSDMVHYGPRAEPNRSVFYKRHALGQAAAITASSHFLAQECERYLDTPHKVCVVPFGVDTRLFSPRRNRPRSEGIVIGFVKHLEPQYGVDDLIAAFEQVVVRYPNARLILAGKGALEQSLRERVYSKGLTNSVDFAGEMPHHMVPDLLSRCDIFVMPSLREALGVSAIEALSMEIPVVATWVGGIPEVVRDSVTGFLVPPGSPDALAEAILRLAEDENLRQRMGREGRRDMIERYEWRECVDRMVAVYRDVTAQQYSFGK